MTDSHEAPRYILAGDIGGTNTSLALMEYNAEQKDRHFSLLHRKMFSSQKLHSINEAIQEAVSEFTSSFPDAQIGAACLSIAGPVVDNRCVPTNIKWTVDGNAISRDFGFRTIVINDFTAICYGIPLLDVANPEEITALPHPGDSTPAPREYLPGIGVQAVLGAGTGLGVGYLIEERDRILALPAEGGHVDFAPFDDITRELQLYMERKIGAPPEPEMFVSGLGIPNIFSFFVDEKGADSPAVKEIAAMDRAEQPQAISKNADVDATCRKVMELFVRMYARAAHNLSLSYIPKKGLFLAGGIAAKNKRFFMENHLFMKTFLQNYQPTIRPVLADIPVYIVEDYKISLFGAAHAYVQLIKFLAS